MTRASRVGFVAALVLAACRVTTAGAFDVDEHEVVADSIYHEVLREFGMTVPDFDWQGKTFGTFCASMAADDRSPARYHYRGVSILRQLRMLPAADVEKAWRAHGDGEAHSAERRDLAVAANYFLHHYIAVRRARDAGRAEGNGMQALHGALAYEALAQGYLADAFSSGHIMTSLPDPLRRLTSTNHAKAHDWYVSEGVYVVNSSGEAWRTFGDKLLLWYGPTRRFVFDACRTSMREVLLAYVVGAGYEVPEAVERWAGEAAGGRPLREWIDEWCAVRSGDAYYSEIRMPVLMKLPMPVSATWSIRGENVDEHGIRARTHYPQLREAGLHDPDLDGIDTEFLYSREDFPPWMIPAAIEQRGPKDAIRYDADVASVRYEQDRNYPPSYRGVLFTIGSGWIRDATASAVATTIGFGYGLLNNFLFLNKISVDMVFNPTLDETRRMLIAPTVRGGIGLPVELPYGLVEATRLEIGYVWGLRDRFTDSGTKLAVGLESSTIPLRLTYAGLTLRFKYQWLYFSDTIEGVLFELVFH